MSRPLGGGPGVATAWSSTGSPKGSRPPLRTSPPRIRSGDDAAPRMDRLVPSWPRRYHWHRSTPLADRLERMDTRTEEQRRRIMQAVKSRDTGPEMVVRRLLHSLGYRYRLHRKDLPGRPDVAFLSRRKAIFVHGCFWHGHGCPKGRPPKSRLDYWKPKLEGNRERDRRKEDELRSMGWSVLVIWQCETTDLGGLVRRLHGFLGNRSARPASRAGRGNPPPSVRADGRSAW